MFQNEVFCFVFGVRCNLISPMKSHGENFVCYVGDDMTCNEEVPQLNGIEKQLLSVCFFFVRKFFACALML